MAVSKRVVDSFIGNAGSLSVKLKNTRHTLRVQFGDIKIPKSAVKGDVDWGAIEKKHSCFVKDMGIYYSVTPKCVKEIIKRDGFLSSIDDKHKEELRKWIEKTFPYLLMDTIHF